MNSTKKTQKEPSSSPRPTPRESGRFDLPVIRPGASPAKIARRLV